ncbi:MAG TPA: HAMP domain-containing histidine kinase [bacterium]|nr:HAMP domain-containing histidine kinase [bacterium]
MSGVRSDHLPGLIGHELRNPLASAMTGAMLARDMVDAEDPRAIVLDGVLKDLDRMTGLIDGWLQMAREQQTAQSCVDLEELLRTIAARHRVDVISVPPSAVVRGNRFLLERAIENLCENARNAGATSVRIAAQHDGERVAVHVEDNGRGVAEHDVERIFEPGWSSGEGTGLGLHAVAETVAASDGEVRCVPLPTGTRFTITLPRGQYALS